MIYSHAARYPDCQDLYGVYYRRLSSSPPPKYPLSITTTTTIPPQPYRPPLRTPTILLLSRRITAECLPLLRARPLLLDRLPPFRMDPPPDRGHMMRLADFVGPATLQGLGAAEVRMGLGEGPLGSGWAWRRVLDELLGLLSRRNRLARLRLLVRLCDPDDGIARPVWDGGEWDCFWYILDVRLLRFLSPSPPFSCLSSSCTYS